MNQEQYRCLCENRWSRGPRALGEPGRPGYSDKTVISAIVGRAAKVLRRREAAAMAWQRAVGSEWLAETAVDGVVGDTLYVSASSSVLCYELERRRPALEKRIAAVARGIRRLRFVVGERPARGPKSIE